MSAEPDGIVERRISALLDERCRDEAVIALHGARSVGKSTVLRTFAASHGVEVIDLDDPLTRDAVAATPSVVSAGTAPICVDEYQHVPELLDSLKARLNAEGSLAGTAVITGSTRHDALPRTAQALTGRLHTMTIWPLSQGELAGTTENLLPSLRADALAAVNAVPTSTTTRTDYIERLCAGGFPLALRRTPAARDRWFDDFITQSIERDALELVRVRQRDALREVLGGLAARTGQILNLNQLAQPLEVSRKTVELYVRLLEDLFLVTRLSGWGTTLRARTSTRPKVHVVDSGMAARLLRLTPAKLATLNPTALTEFGHLLETFVVGELRKQVSWLETPATVGHWRTREGHEVDLVIEFDDGGVLAFEVKAAERVRSSDLTGLRELRETLGDRLLAGIALTTGPRSYTIEERLHVMPTDRLWMHVGV